MDERQYSIIWPSPILMDGPKTACMLTSEQLAALESQIQAIRAKEAAEKVKPKPWDFAKFPDGTMRIHGNRSWSQWGNPLAIGCHDDDDDCDGVRVLGNFKKIVEDGPVVVGLSITDATAFVDTWAETPSPFMKRTVEKLKAALERCKGLER